MRVSVFAAAAALSALAASPALAAYDRIGAISVDYNRDRDAVSPDFGGPVEGLQLAAQGSDIQCKYIRVAFGNGQSKNLFSGRLAQNQPRNFDLPGTDRNIKRIETNCRAFRAGGASIQISADIGSYRDTWRRSPNWSRMWAKMFSWADHASSSVDASINYWTPVTTLHFSGMSDRDGTAGSWSTQSITAIGLKPLNTDARCDRIAVTFKNGQKVNLGSRAKLARGQIEKFDLPGSDRNIAKLNLSCRALGRGSVDIQVSGRK